jgi:hypothetical protein
MSLPNIEHDLFPLLIDSVNIKKYDLPLRAFKISQMFLFLLVLALGIVGTKLELLAPE